MTSNSPRDGKLYSSSGAKHPEATSVRSRFGRKQAERFEFAQTQSLGSIFEIDAANTALPGARGFAPWQVFLIVILTTAVSAVVDGLITDGFSWITRGVFMLISILVALKARAFADWAVWTAPIFAITVGSLISTIMSTDLSSSAVLGILMGVFLLWSENAWFIVATVVICWFLGRRTLVAYRVAAKRARRHSGNGPSRSVSTVNPE